MSKVIAVDDKGKITLSTQGEQIPEFKSLRLSDHSAGKKYFENVLRYIFYAHDRESIFNNLTLKTRIAIVKKDMFSDMEDTTYGTMVNNLAVKGAITKLNLLQYTPAERHLKVCEDKLEQFEALYAETEVTHDNFEKIAAQLRGSNSLYDVIEKARDKVIKEGKEQGLNDYEPSMFETE